MSIQARFPHIVCLSSVPRLMITCQQVGDLLIEFIPGYFWYHYKFQSLIIPKIAKIETLNTIFTGVLGVSPAPPCAATYHTLSFLFS